MHGKWGMKQKAFPAFFKKVYRSQNQRIMELEVTYKVIWSNPCLNVGTKSKYHQKMVV